MMQPRVSRLILGLGVAGAFLLSNATLGAQEPARKVNILLIAVDDLNCSLGCYGHPVVKTPNIDRLAARGVRFDRAYCQYPLCNPSRTSFLSGRLPDATRIFDNNTSPRTHLGKDYVFLPEHYKKHDYFTGRVGKIAHGRFESAVKWDVSEGPGGRAKLKPEPAADAPAGGGLKIAWRITDRKDEDEPDGRTARRVVQLLEKHK